MIDLLFIGIMLSLGINFFLLFTRKRKWNTWKVRWIIASTLLVVAVVCIVSSSVKNYDTIAFAWCLSTVFIYNLLESIFDMISKRTHGRTFYLWLRGSEEINYNFGAKNEHVKLSDKLISLTLLLFIFILPIIGSLFKA